MKLIINALGERFTILSLRHPIFIKSLIHNGLATFIMPVSPRILNFWGRCGDAKRLFLSSIRQQGSLLTKVFLKNLEIKNC